MKKAVLLIGLVGAGIAYVAYRIYKEIQFLHRVAIDTMDVNNKVETLYSRCMEALIREGITDQQRLQTICNTLITGFRPNFAM